PPAAPQIRSGAPAVEPPAIEKPAGPPAQPLWRRPPAEPTPSSVEPPPNVAASPQYPEPKPSIVEPAPSVPEPTPSIAEPTPSGLFVEISPVPSAPPTVTPPTPEPSGVDFREIIRSASGVAPSVAAETQPIRRTGDQAAAPNARPEPDYVTFEGPVSSRAASLGLALDAPPAAIEAEPPARQIPVL